MHPFFLKWEEMVAEGSTKRSTRKLFPHSVLIDPVLHFAARLDLLYSGSKIFLLECFSTRQLVLRNPRILQFIILNIGTLKNGNKCILK